MNIFIHRDNLVYFEGIYAFSLIQLICTYRISKVRGQRYYCTLEFDTYIRYLNESVNPAGFTRSSQCIFSYIETTFT